MHVRDINQQSQSSWTGSTFPPIFAGLQLPGDLAGCRILLRRSICAEDFLGLLSHNSEDHELGKAFPGLFTTFWNSTHTLLSIDLQLSADRITKMAMHVSEKPSGNGNGHLEKTGHTQVENGVATPPDNGHFGDNFNAVHEPAVHFDIKREDRLYRKIDGRLLWILALLYLVAFLDRGK